MRRMHSILSLTLVFILLAGPKVRADEKEDYYARFKTSWLYMQQVYEQLSRRYVEDIDPYPLIRAGINGMLSELDPYTVFLEEDGQRQLRIMTTGKYGGLGMEIGLRNKRITVIAPIDNSPAQRSGIRAGDIVDKIDGTSTKGMNVNDVSKKLRGKIGTQVTLTIVRPGLNEPLDITLTRAQIVLKDVGYSGFLQPGIGYVSLNSFTDKAVQEVKSAITALQKEAPLKGFILDLRGNPGGLLESAVKIVNIFVPKNELVVSTKGFREKEYKFYTTDDPILPDIPLVVLVNSGSASASEIVSGALQDLDRAVIVGEDTFGKGLVQKVFTLDRHKQVKLKMTTAKYYIPSGRCIQKKDYAEGSEVIVHDSLQTEQHTFFTKNKRQVLDRGGVYPDVEVPGDSISLPLMQLVRGNMIFDFAVQYHQKYPEWKTHPVVDDSVKARFNAFLQAHHFQYQYAGNSDVKHLRSYVKKERFSGEVNDLLDHLEEIFRQKTEQDALKNQAQIWDFLHLEMIGKYFGRTERDRISLQQDRQAQRALEVLQNISEYRTILATK